MALDYQELIDSAMLDIVRKILLETQDEGLSDEQCFYISFRTDAPEVILSKQVKARYPKEITIVLQYQYKNLQVLKDRFSVNIAFNSIPETIEVPFASLTSFVDPLENFSLQFRSSQDLDSEIELFDDIEFSEEASDFVRLEPKKPSKSPKSKEKTAGEVISIDKFRKKN